MTSMTLGRTWDEASSPEVVRLVQQFESAWRAARGTRPDPLEFLPARPGERPGALLALLRTDLALRREAGESVRVEWYQCHYPVLDDEALVALIYEEYCLREEAGEIPDPVDYEARFPAIADRLREIIEIHGFVAECPSTAPHPPEPDADWAFPESGQTLAGFRLVEELGRGSFARVFRAEELRLADRPVVLKISRLGTREPQTLARLQHTHIVPVYSYRSDPARGLHLLCMPYFGRLTLARVLAEPAVAAARSGAALVAALDRLQTGDDRPRSAARNALAQRTYPRAIAWWGARLAEALQHAHERGVLHRDIKPSNVLVTEDGLPMLLDFNLAHDPADLTARSERIGGTLAYMAPEHLEALIEQKAGPIDHRADLYSLALVLLEALGFAPIAQPAQTQSTAAVLFRYLEARRSGPPETREGGRSIPPAFQAALRRCLAPDPAGRYDSAAELAADLQAVADGTPLPFTREPMASRVTGWVRRNRLPMAVAIPIIAILIGFTATWFQAQAERVRRESEVHQLYTLGRQWLDRGDCARAAIQFETAAEQAEGWSGLRELKRAALRMREEALTTGAIRAKADTFSGQADPLRFHLLGFGGDAAAASRELEDALVPFGVLDDSAWSHGDELGRLDPSRRQRLLEEVNELLFLWVVAVGTDHRDEPEMARRALRFCDRALAFAEPRGPWNTLRDWWRWRLGALGQPPVLPHDVARETSARACFQWGLLANLQHDRRATLAWLDRAWFLQPDNYWHQYAFAYHLEQAGDVELALQHYEAAVALRPRAPWAGFSRAHLYAFRRGAWSFALRDLDLAVTAPGDWPADRARFRIERGKVRQAVGDIWGARADFEAAIAVDPCGRLARAARIDRARLFAEAGALRRARAEYDALLDTGPSDSTARLARARLAMRQGRAAEAEADLTRLLSEGPHLIPKTRADWLASRALARLALGRAAEAEADAKEALRLDLSPIRARIRARVALGAGRPIDDRLLHPDAIDEWPVGGPAIVADLRTAIDRLRPATSDPSGTTAAAALRARAAMLSALGEDAAAVSEADRAVDRAPSVMSYALRAEVRLRAGDRSGALSDVERGLACNRDDPSLLVLRGRLASAAGNPDEALRWLNRALFQGAAGAAHAWRARVLMDLHHTEEAVEAWSAALAFDPEDAHAYLGRARSLRRLGLWENALADLERAVERVPDGSTVFAQATLEYLACLPARADRLPRVVGLALRLLVGRSLAAEGSVDRVLRRLASECPAFGAFGAIAKDRKIPENL
jgi:serine/threonine protein kinase/predicted Zn-dependent protease